MHYTKYCKDLLNSCAVEQVIKHFSLFALYNLTLRFYLAARIYTNDVHHFHYCLSAGQTHSGDVPQHYSPITCYGMVA